MNLVLVLVVAVVARPVPVVGQRLARLHVPVELVPADGPVAVRVHEGENVVDQLLLALLRHLAVRLVEEPVRPLDLLALPVAVLVVVVQREERVVVEVGNVVLLCAPYTCKLSCPTSSLAMSFCHTGHVSGHPIGIWWDQRLMTTPFHVVAMRQGWADNGCRDEKRQEAHRDNSV